MFTSNLKNIDSKVFSIIKKEERKQEDELQLIASENYVSNAVLEAIGSVFTNRYSEGYPKKRYYAGQENVDDIENLAIERAKELFGAEYVNVQPLSGSPANLAVFLAVLKPGDTIMGMALDQGGHLSHGHSKNFSGLLYNIVSYGVNKESGLIDMDEVEQIAKKHKPKLIIAGFSAYSRNLEWQRFREIADEVGAILMADIAHIAGLIAGKALYNPVPICDIVTTTTHKTLRGPRGAIIMSKQKYEKNLSSAVFPGIQGGPHENLIAAKAVAFKEAMNESFREYANQVIKNTKRFSENLINSGIKIISGGSDNHLLLIDIYSSFGIGGQEAESILEKSGIIVNKNMVPYDTRKPMNPSGIRIGTAAITTRGMKENEIDIISNLFIETIKNRGNLEKISEIKKRVLALCEKFPIYRNMTV